MCHLAQGSQADLCSRPENELLGTLYVADGQKVIVSIHLYLKVTEVVKLFSDISHHV